MYTIIIYDTPLVTVLVAKMKDVMLEVHTSHYSNYAVGCSVNVFLLYKIMSATYLLSIYFPMNEMRRTSL